MAWNGSDGAAAVPRKAGCAAGNGRGGASNPAHRPFAAFRGILAALVVVVGAGAAWWWFARPAPKPEAPLRDVKKGAAPSAARPKPAAAKSGASHAETPQEPKVAVKPAATGDWQIVNGFKVPKGARLVRNSLTNRRERVFARATDALIASYIEPPTGGIMPPPLPMPGNAGKKFLESLATPIEIAETDSEEVRRLKESVIIARAQIKQMMDEGRSFEDILSEHYRLSADNAKIRQSTQKELDAIYSQGDIDGAAKYKRTMDLAFQQMGIDALDEPMTHAERKRQRKLQNEAREAASANEQENERSQE